MPEPRDGRFDIDLGYSGSVWSGAFRTALRVVCQAILAEGPHGPVRVLYHAPDSLVELDAALVDLSGNSIVVQPDEGDDEQYLEIELNTILRFRA